MSPSDPDRQAELQKLIKKRNQVKKSMKSIKAFIDKYDPSTRSLNQLQTRLDSLMQYMSKYEALQDEIEDSDSVTNEMLDDRVSTDDFFCSLKAEVLDLVERNNKSTSDVSTAQSHSITRDSMKLPSIPAPTFNGELQNWVSFLDSFNAMFHQNTGLSDVQRLHYLKSCLVGPAVDVIRTIPTTDVNYHTAYNALVERYENKSLIIQSHIRSLFQTPQVQRPTASELRQLHHHVVSQVNALQALGQNIHEWDAWLVTLLCCRLDPTTVGEWQLLQTSKDLPKFRDLEKFLANRVSAYEVGEVNNQSTQLKPLSGERSMQKKVLFAHQDDSSPSKERKCIVCPGHHRLTMCENFNKMSIAERQDVVFKNRLCHNCLHPGHQVRQCRSFSCTKCGRRHNTKLHNDAMFRPPTLANEQSSSTQDEPVVTYVEQANNNPAVLNQIMLATAVVNLTNSTGQQIPCRAILDSGSQVCLITKECASRLHISGVQTTISLAGIGSVTARTGTTIGTTMCSRLRDYEAYINFHVIDSITNKLPIHRVNINQLNIPDTITHCLADPGFHEPGKIDVLLGAELFYELLIGESKKTQEGTVLHNTCLGWVLTGSMPIANSHMCMSSLLVQCQSISSLAPTDRPTCSVKNVQSIAESHFTRTVTQDHSGRFVVQLPFIRDPEVLGDSKFMAQRRFFNLERKMNRDPMLAQEYKKFMAEYIQMGHMEEAEDTDLPTYYLPHHTVTKSDSLTTKTRVVFDGSAVTRSGLSLNDILVCGPPVQPELLSIVLRFRLYRYALVADNEKMYRQVWVAPSDCDMQRIVYRSNADIAFNSKCPIVLPSRSNVTQLIFKHEHNRLLHIGPQGLLANIHLRYWPLRGRLIAKKTVRNCITCFRSSPKFITPFMAPLPRERVNIERPFARTGVDFCGPILIRSGIRRVVSVKCYIAVFVCFVTRAVHLELVNGLTSDAFLAALTRFMARRGHCSHIYSDNGTNFVGSNKVLYSYFKKTKGQRTVEEELSHHHVQWHFIPPSAPHFGGLWEAAVKSTKKHLLKINTMGLLTFEEMSTMLCRVEAVLNSRPISPMSDDPSDFTALTPGHFLVGGVLTLPAEPDGTGIPLNRLKRLELVRVQAQTFWKRWSSEYLPQLHKRGCWLSKKDNIEVGSLAILNGGQLPP
ncbi:uncharacterized protein LOC103309543 [Acyrthosiphon pisum]|uniref:Integrase catalytic domain-containing protein n=1 Tax=Acyrthosiphon pisum TaxID=7029 RepID=A0A8R2B679_ACYPI|nr:uncharacterized protein LOC103309543 [Acyrthosiphon pisum]|eukprot:XP_008183407.1 PREDICTED: uncharacterized protein LOC103309543 [Acyrthosiphon pisum]